MVGKKWKEYRGISFLVIAVCYVIAALGGAIIYLHIGGALWQRLFLADTGATIIIWITSMILKNASVYDPYWSVQPVVILLLLLIKNGKTDAGALLVYIAVAYWGIRLTANWAYTFKGLAVQDWRYDQLKKSTGQLFQLVNLVGIQLMPTFIVYLCILPAVYYIEQNNMFHRNMLIGILLCIVAATLQLIADIQMQSFRKQNTDKTRLIRNGLWKHSRHPNYLGEILMWWGIYLIMLFTDADKWFLCAGALANTLLFLFISIPMAEKRLAGYKAGYEEYKKETRMLLPFPRSMKRRK